MSVSPFLNEWVRVGCGCPIIHIGFSMVPEKKRFIVHASQKPLHRICCLDWSWQCINNGNNRAAGGGMCCGCGNSSDSVCRYTSPDKKVTTYHKPHAFNFPNRHRFWPGNMKVSIYRAPGYSVSADIDMSVSPGGSGEIIENCESNVTPHLIGQQLFTSQLTIPYVTPRRHEYDKLHTNSHHRNRKLRDDELVFGWICMEDLRWCLLSKIVICQSPLMWCNALLYSRKIETELSAIDALQHIKGYSVNTITALNDCLLGTPSYNDSSSSHQVAGQPVTYYYCNATRIEASKALVHCATYLNDKDALVHINNYLTKFVNSAIGANSTVVAGQLMIISSLLETYAFNRRYMSFERRETRNCFETAAYLLEQFDGLSYIANTQKNSSSYTKTCMNMLLGSVCKALILSSLDLKEKSIAKSLIEPRFLADIYGYPINSDNYIILEIILTYLSFSASNWNFIPNLVFIEHIIMNVCNNNINSQRLLKAASKAYMTVLGLTAGAGASGSGNSGVDSEYSWCVRFNWIVKFTDVAVLLCGTGADITVSILLNVWETIFERVKREAKSPIATLFRTSKELTDQLWYYIVQTTPRIIQIHPSVTSIGVQIQQILLGIYLHIYGTGLPLCYRAPTPSSGDNGGLPMSFFAPTKDIEKAYRRLAMHGTTARGDPAPVITRQQQQQQQQQQAQQQHQSQQIQPRRVVRVIKRVRRITIFDRDKQQTSTQQQQQQSR